ncbi:hypothetical protein GFB56_32855 [Ensifer sp. T173]|uniref:Uncharacterized protein n=1 Tax=Ensifer canadensis TaxID=555315 RepID=A0AAW4FW32_9HYPH|nr:hypothetical protein [Ensifer canadensis]MBM3095514.1 hypothetical protein [Ensifer canadensis]UBI79110.1 hypothetical protein J3R84_23720 [Ensifer canadensis]
MNSTLPRIVKNLLVQNGAKRSPIAYAIVHDLAHTLVVGNDHDRTPAYSVEKFNQPIARLRALDRDMLAARRDTYKVAFLCQNTQRPNYIYPMLHALEQDRRFHDKSNLAIDIVYYGEPVSADFLKAIEWRVRERHGKTVSVSQTSVNSIMERWVPDEQYIDTLFAQIEKIASLQGTENIPETVIQESVESVCSAYSAFVQYFGASNVQAVYTANDQWHPTSSAFAAAVTSGVRTILSYHGTIPEFALYSYADTVYYYSYRMDAETVFPIQSARFVPFSTPLDIYQFELKHPTLLFESVLERDVAKRGSTLGIVAALSGDLTYSITDYASSLQQCLQVAAKIRNSGASNLQVLILPHPSDKRSNYEAAYNDFIARSGLPLDKVKVNYGMDLLDFATRCGPIIGCPSTAFDSLFACSYPARVVASEMLLHEVFGYNPYANSPVHCDDTADLAVFARQFLEG